MKYILIFNGYPKSGKTTFENIIAEKYDSTIFSSIKPIIDFADNIFENCNNESLKNLYNYEKNKKSNKYRKLLSDIKNNLSDFDNGMYNNSFIVNEVNKFINDYNKQFLMIDIREPKNIYKTIKIIKSTFYDKLDQFKIKTVFIRREWKQDYGNISDDNVENYQYDIVVNNIGTLDTLKNECLKAFIEVLYSDWEM